MEIVRNNLNIDVIPFLEDLKGITGIENKAYFSDTKDLKLTVIDSWTEESELDSLISTHDLDNFVIVDRSDVTKFNFKELKKKLKKQATLKDKIVQFSFDKKTNIVKFKFKAPFDQTDVDLLDSILDNLLGYDALTEIAKDYVLKSKDGKNYWKEKHDEFVLSVLSGTITSLQAYDINQQTRFVKDSLKDGDWITAYRDMLATTVTGGYTQAVYDTIFDYITNYINTNYPAGTLDNL